MIENQPQQPGAELEVVPGYEPPLVEDLDSTDGPAVTAAGSSVPT